MLTYIQIADRLSAWVGKAFAWCIIIMTLGVSYEVFVRYVLNSPTVWAFDMTYILYGTMFMMAGAYTLSRDGHVRADVVYRLWRPRVQASVELVLYFLFFFPGITAFMVAGWRYASRSWRYLEVSSMSPAGIPIFQFKSVIVVAGALLFVQGIAQVFRCILCIRLGEWPPRAQDVEEMEKLLMERGSLERLEHGSEAVDLAGLDDPAADPRRRTGR